jgi:hypothetical protein
MTETGQSQERNRKGTRFLVGSLIVMGAAVAVYLLVDYLGKPAFAADYETYESIEEMAAASDAVVVATVEAEILKWEDRGGDPEEIEGVPVEGHPMALYEVTVTDSLGEVDPGPSLVLARTDVSRVRGGPSALREGSEVLLFLELVTRDEAPGLPEGYDEVWVIIGGDGGIFDVEEQSVHPRLGSTRLTESGPSATSFTLDEVAQVVG